MTLKLKSTHPLQLRTENQAGGAEYLFGPEKLLCRRENFDAIAG